MAVIANSRRYVEAPGVPQRYGLFTVANGPLDMPDHAEYGGLEFETPRCVLPAGYNSECPPAAQDAKTFLAGPTTVIGDPFVVRSSITCGAVGMTNERLRSLVFERLTAGGQARVEDIISRETFGSNPGFLGATVITPDCAVDDVRAVVGALEEAAYAAYGPAITLHVPFKAASYVKAEHLIEKDGPIWRTPAGSAVSIGNYANLSPAGAAAAAGTAWIYATSQVTIWHTPDPQVFIPSLEEALNRTTNQVLGQAERWYIVAFECVLSAANVVLCTP